MTAALDLSARPAAPAALRPTHRHAVAAGTAILLLPCVLFAAQMRALPAAALLAGVAGTGALALARPARPSAFDAPLAPGRLALCLLAAAALALLGGEGHMFYANPDWLWRDAVLSDLARAPFPPSYAIDGRTELLRAPLGMYMVPALVARLSGLAAGHAALFAQNATLLGLALYLLATLAGRGAALAAAAFLSFSGLDALGEVLVRLKAGNGAMSLALPSHIENWMPGLQYSSTLTQIFWVPNHALPAYWLALLAWACRRGETGLGTLVAAAAASLFWSPFPAIGALPLGFYLIARAPRAALSWDLGAGLATALGFLPTALYLQADAAAVPHALLLADPAWWPRIALFLQIEIPQAAPVLAAWPWLPRDLRGLAAASVAFLLALPAVAFGANNDLVMRASIPALMLLAVVFAASLPVLLARRPALFAAAAAMALVGAVTPALEVARALTFPPASLSRCDLVTVWKKLEPTNPDLANYLAHPSPDLALLFGEAGAPALADVPEAVCWPDLPFDPRLGVGQLSSAELRRAREEHGPLGL